MMVMTLSYAQTITGKVIDQESIPIIGATISYSNSLGEKGGAVTSENGDFELQLSQSGEYTLTIAYIGLSSKNIKQNFNQNQSYNIGEIKLDEEVQILQSVEVGDLWGVGRQSAPSSDYNSNERASRRQTSFSIG